MYFVLSGFIRFSFFFLLSYMWTNPVANLAFQPGGGGVKELKGDQGVRKSDAQR